MTLTPYKAVTVLAGTIAAGAALFFARTDTAQVHAIEAAELGAAAVDIASERGGQATATVWIVRQWEEDTSVTNQWGGYATFDISGVTWWSPIADGTYAFSYRAYGSLRFTTDLANGENSYVGNVIDVYTNTVTAYAWLDCGPAGSTVTRYPFAFAPNLPRTLVHSWYLRPTTGPDPYGLEVQVWTNIEAGVMFPASYVSVGDGTQYGFPISFTFTNATYPTSGVSRIRYYNPRVLRTYTNTVLNNFSQNEIGGIRGTIAANLGYGSAPCWIGPTNADANYDGVTEFPLVSTSAWRTVYTNWAAGFGCYTQIVTTTDTWSTIRATLTNGSYQVIQGISDGAGGYASADSKWVWSHIYNYAGYYPADPPYWYSSNQAPPCVLYPHDALGAATGGLTIYAGTNALVQVHTNVYTNAYQSIFIKTNELAWHYSAMYRLRDLMYTYSPASTNYGYEAEDPSYDAAGNWATNKWVFDNGYFRGASIEPNVPHGWIKTIVEAPVTNVIVDLAAIACVVGPLYTDVVHTVEFYAKASVSSQGGTYNSFGETPMSTNEWKLFDTVGPTTAGMVTSAFYGALNFPDVSLAVPGQTHGWQAQLVPVIRWQQRACTNAIFDGRY